MMTRPPVPVRDAPSFLRRYLRRVGTDSLVRNSLYLMASTVVTAALGYAFWVLAAHMFSSREVGTASAVISLCSTVALLTYLGSSATLIERLPSREHSPEWTKFLTRVCALTVGVTAAVTAAVVPVLSASAQYQAFFGSVRAVLAAVLGAAAWTLVNLLGSAFIAARRAGQLLFIQTLVSLAKLLFVVPLAAAGAGVMGLVGAWVAAALLGAGAGVLWLIPQLRLGRRPGPRAHRRPEAVAEARVRARRRARHKRPAEMPDARSVRRLLGQHLTSVGGAVTPLVLPVLVSLRLGVVQNAYFYITWMVGSAFFMVSPSVAQAVFAEGVRAQSNLGRLVVKALRVIAALLIPAMVVVVAAGQLVLRLFGSSYATAGYGLLVILAISALPDAVSNVAVVVCRVTLRLGYSSALNLAILVMTLGGAWFLMPRLGITGAGAAWLGAQVVGAIASLPLYARIRGTVAPPQPVLDPGIALLIEIAEQQSLDRLTGHLP